MKFPVQKKERSYKSHKSSSNGQTSNRGNNRGNHRGGRGGHSRGAWRGQRGGYQGMQRERPAQYQAPEKIKDNEEVPHEIDHEEVIDNVQA